MVEAIQTHTVITERDQVTTIHNLLLVHHLTRRQHPSTKATYHRHRYPNRPLPSHPRHNNTKLVIKSATTNLAKAPSSKAKWSMKPSSSMSNLQARLAKSA